MGAAEAWLAELRAAYRTLTRLIEDPSAPMQRVMVMGEARRSLADLIVEHTIDEG